MATVINFMVTTPLLETGSLDRDCYKVEKPIMIEAGSYNSNTNGWSNSRYNIDRDRGNYIQAVTSGTVPNPTIKWFCLPNIDLSDKKVYRYDILIPMYAAYFYLTNENDLNARIYTGFGPDYNSRAGQTTMRIGNSRRIYDGCEFKMYRMCYTSGENSYNWWTVSQLTYYMT